MKYGLLLLLALSTVFWFSCKSTQKSYTLEDYEGRRILFGNRGGFAGGEMKYIIFENGQVYKSKRRTEIVQIDRLDEKTVKQLFENIDNLNLREEKIMDRGNLTAFIHLREEDGATKWEWGENGKPSQQLKIYYKTLFGLMTNLEKPTK